MRGQAEAHTVRGIDVLTGTEKSTQGRTNMRLRYALLTAAAAALPLAAQAQPVNGLYLGAGVGINLMQNNSVSQTRSYPILGGLSSSGSGNLSSTAGPAGVLSLGWGFGNGFRAEVEGNYMANKFNGASGTGSLTGFPAINGSINTAGGWEQKFGGMLNGFYDFNGLAPWIVPFVGLGIGYEAVSLHGATASGPPLFAGITERDSITNSTQGSFAYQAMVGAAFPISAAPGLSITAEYRFMGLAGDRNYSSTTTLSAGGGSVSGTGTTKISSDYNHAVLIGFRYAFGAAPPPPAPAPMAAPAPAPARSYLVFFDWDKATLTARAQQIIKEAADNSTKVQYTRIEVNGYTDTSGTPQYNQGLSVRRAQAVAAELVKDGVPKNAIAIQGFGETHLLVPTGPGVREPQNRRVEIIIR